MKLINNKSLFHPLCLLFFAFLFSCTHEHGPDSHNHEVDLHTASDGEEHMDHDHGKVVYLNEAQYLNAEIDTGWFEMKNISNVIHANGYTELAPQNRADVSLPVAGIVRSIKVIEGDHVKKGQLLGSVTSKEFNELLLEKARIEQVFKEANEQIVYLQAQYDRQQALSLESINAKKTFEKVSADLKVAQVRAAGLKQQLKLLEQSIQLVGKPSSFAIPIIAPINGYVTQVNINIGTAVRPGMSMFLIVDNSQMHVDLKIYEKDLNRIEIGQKVRFIFSNQSNKEVMGSIYNIGKAFATQSKAVTVHADIENFDGKLIPGMYVNALIDMGDEKVKTLPQEAVVTAEGRTFIFLWEKENAEVHSHSHEDEDHAHAAELSFARLEVKTGASKLGFVAVTPLEEIHEGDKIVTGGAYYLQSHLQKSEGGGGHHH